ncbi:hypothetical protein KSX_52590 [Ktedonospora formicarum]|uniref:Uncharacterized protein n=1 Tax=Ktedonospora formicarum TaxID=2778364 RepID=A0A8J3MUN2_9CHLR|nr:hypothetical protein KSX_52590 [Ktedonospora formicarum]
MLTGRNSADQQMQADAWELFAEGVGSLFLATHDGGFALCARGLKEREVFVVRIGSWKCQMSRKLRQEDSVLK